MATTTPHPLIRSWDEYQVLDRLCRGLPPQAHTDILDGMHRAGLISLTDQGPYSHSPIYAITQFGRRCRDDQRMFVVRGKSHAGTFTYTTCVRRVQGREIVQQIPPGPDTRCQLCGDACKTLARIRRQSSTPPQPILKLRWAAGEDLLTIVATAPQDVSVEMIDGARQPLTAGEAYEIKVLAVEVRQAEENRQ